MNEFKEYIETKIMELAAESKNLDENYRQDDAVFVKIKANVYDVCKTVFSVFEKTKKESSLYNDYINKQYEFEKTWSDSADKAKEFGDAKKLVAEEAKLEALADIKAKFIELWSERNERG